MDAEDRAAARAFLQRSEVRLSTVHRVASALLSGAGLMVLLPAIQRDTVVIVLRALLTGPVTLVDSLLAVGVVMSLLVPLVALGLLLRDLTTFYFHANHLGGPGEPGTYTPRFTLTGLQLPADDLSPAGTTLVDRARTGQAAMELLVPHNDATRARIDERIAVYDLGRGEELDDRARVEALFALTASRSRGLADEVAKIEHGLARHLLGIQNIVLRYAKALLALLATALCAYAAAGVVQSGAGDAGSRAWLAVILMVWTVLAVGAVLTPLRWIERRLRADGATRTAVARDRELTRVERTTIGLAVVGHLCSGVALGRVVVGGDVAGSTVAPCVVLGVVSLGALGVLLVNGLLRYR